MILAASVVKYTRAVPARSEVSAAWRSQWSSSAFPQVKV